MTTSNNNKSRVVIIEDHHAIRDGMVFLINNDPDFIAIPFSKAEDALIAFEKLPPDIVLMDINLPGIDGIETTKIIKQKYPQTQIMMCTVYEDDDKIFRALAAGANGYILKRAAGESLIESIRQLQQGGAPMSSTIAKKVVSFFQNRNNVSAASELLTARENEILDLLAKGYRNKEIADKLSLSTNTIRTHIYHIYDKLHVQTRVEALNKTGRGGGRLF
ncbi:MAG: response regulator transcription factor [Bacteroidia bacterium]|nr:response regulator transcription factor [Bacteroidia bacterium]MCZ2276774.1 response regulator transcription factor [Bacteroidia bacterium]